MLFLFGSLLTYSYLCGKERNCCMEDKKALTDGLLNEQERYINPYTDFGFKKLFGTEMNKDLLISFLNALFNDTSRNIEDIEYLNGENLGEGYGDRRSVFDVYCKATDGSRFIVEMQKADQANFKDRSIYYATTPIRQQATKGDWDYHLDNVYTVGVLNFEFPHGEYSPDSYFHVIKLKDVEDNHVFYDKLTFFYLEMPKFTKTEDELVTMLDKWMFVLHNLARLLDRPKALQDRIFQKVFDQAEIAKYSDLERRQYEESRKVLWDNYSVMKTATDRAMAKGRAEGRAEGLAEGRAEGLAEGEKQKSLDIARNLRNMGMSNADITQATGLSEEELTQL